MSASVRVRRIHKAAETDLGYPYQGIWMYGNLIASPGQREWEKEKCGV